MELKVREPVTFKDGLHNGVISKIEYRDTPYKYTDVFIKERRTHTELKYSCPTSGITKGKLMRLIANFKEIKVDETVDIEKTLIDKEVSFMTLAEKKGENIYSNIVDGSVKPVVEIEEVLEPTNDSIKALEKNTQKVL